MSATGIVFSGCPSTAFVPAEVITTNCSGNLVITYRGNPLAPADDAVRWWRSKANVTASHRGSGGIHVDAGAYNSHLLA